MYVCLVAAGGNAPIKISFLSVHVYPQQTAFAEDAGEEAIAALYWFRFRVSAVLNIVRIAVLPYQAKAATTKVCTGHNLPRSIDPHELKGSPRARVPCGKRNVPVPVTWRA
jgi:hypothetical protein